MSRSTITTIEAPDGRRLAWQRHPFGLGTNRASYSLEDQAGQAIAWLRWCGHPTATYPYFTHDGGELRTFRSVAKGKAFLEGLVTGKTAELDTGGEPTKDQLGSRSRRPLANDRPPEPSHVRN